MYPGERVGAADRQGGSEPKFAVNMAAFNAGPYIAAAIDSVIGQSFEDWELVVVNDGSADDTLAVAEHYAALDPRIRVISQPNAGIGAARNAAIAASAAPWIVVFDADDILDPGHLARIAEMLRFNPQTNAWSTALEVFDSETGESLGVWNRPYNEPIDARQIELCELYRTTPNHSGSGYSRALIERIGGYSPDRTMSDDWDMWARLLRQPDAHMRYIPEVGCRYRRHADQFSHGGTVVRNVKLGALQHHLDTYDLPVWEREMLLFSQLRNQMNLEIATLRGQVAALQKPTWKERLARVPGVLPLYHALRKIVGER